MNFNKSVSAALAGGCALLLASAVSAETLRLSHNGPEEHPFQVGALKFKEIVESGTDGAYDVKIFTGDQLGDEEGTAQMVKTGAIACTISSAGGGLAPFVPEVNLLNLPFIFNDLDHFYRVVDGPIGDDIATAVEKNLNGHFAGWMFSGVRNVWNGDRPVNTPKDLAGLKIRVIGSPVVVDAFNALGAQATPMSFGEVYTSLQQGVIDGAETDHIDLLVEKFYEVTKYVSLTGHLYLAAGMVCNKDLYDGLSDEHRAVFDEAFAAAVAAERKAVGVATDEAKAKLDELGIEFNEVDVAPFADLVQAVHAEHAADIGGAELIEKLRAQ